MRLRQGDVLSGAMELLGEVGLDELSTRRLADRLGVRVGALYWHYPSKAALLDAMAEEIIARMVAAPAPGRDWAEQVRELAARAREVMLTHRDGARVATSFTSPPPSALAYLARLTAAVQEGGVPAEQAGLAADAVTSFVNGFTLEEQVRKVGRVPQERLEAAFQVELDIVISGIRAKLVRN